MLTRHRSMTESSQSLRQIEIPKKAVRAVSPLIHVSIKQLLLHPWVLHACIHTYILGVQTCTRVNEYAKQTITKIETSVFVLVDTLYILEM